MDMKKKGEKINRRVLANPPLNFYERRFAKISG